MVLMDIQLDDSYWKQLEITPKDIEFLYSFLLEKETPLPSVELAQALIKERVRVERMSLNKKQQKER